ncbi:MAG TPA: hypothetical protein VF313_04555 [Anaerolineaceae bacterium]
MIDRWPMRSDITCRKVRHRHGNANSSQNRPDHSGISSQLP